MSAVDTQAKLANARKRLQESTMQEAKLTGDIKSLQDQENALLDKLRQQGVDVDNLDGAIASADQAIATLEASLEEAEKELRDRI